MSHEQEPNSVSPEAQQLIIARSVDVYDPNRAPLFDDELVKAIANSLGIKKRRVYSYNYNEMGSKHWQISFPVGRRGHNLLSFTSTTKDGQGNEQTPDEQFSISKSQYFRYAGQSASDMINNPTGIEVFSNSVNLYQNTDAWELTISIDSSGAQTTQLKEINATPIRATEGHVSYTLSSRGNAKQNFHF